MATINLLNQTTIDKIAAGEVVERPASVVKELVENAIDAGATAVTVEIKEGGISLIRVTDNGNGIEKKEIKKAFLRHATSKITSADDLAYVTSLGFRGEALSSIAAVSQVELITKTSEELTGIRYTIEGGQEIDFEEIGAPNGTTFLVRNLFFNTPVRKKFLKLPQTEGSYVSDIIEHMALSKPEIALKFVMNGQTKFATSGNGNLEEVIYRINGREIAAALLPIQEQREGIHIWGFIGKPEINRANRNFENFFVNGRYIKSDLIGKAVEEGYRPYVMQHKFPFVILHLEIDTTQIDVNVHPTKMEIRFTGGNGIYNYISDIVKNKLHEQELIPEAVLVEEEEISPKIEKAPEPFEVNRIKNTEQKESTFYEIDFEEETPEPAASKSQAEEKSEEYLSVVEEFISDTDQVQEESPAYKVMAEERTESEDAQKLNRAQAFLHKISEHKILGQDKTNTGAVLNHNIIKAKEHIIVEKPVQMDLFEEKMLTKEARAEYQILGQIFDTYWLLAFKEKLFFIDQHAAHEKVKYERFMKELKEKKFTSQLLAPPVIITLTGREEEVLHSYMDYFASLGFELEEFGSGSYAIRSVPTDLYGCQEKKLFSEILDELADGPIKGNPEVIEQKLASMACKAAVKGNNALTREEMEALIDELLGLENPYHCPHGRPTIFSMSKYEIDKKFKRII